MNRILSLIGVVLVVGCGPEPRNIETLLEVDGVFMNPVDGQPYSGPVFGSILLPLREELELPDEMGTGWVTGSLKDGEFDGPTEYQVKGGESLLGGELSTEYYINENGQLFLKGTYKDGEFDGPLEIYVDGQLFAKTIYKDGEFNGLSEVYDPENGELVMKGILKDGEKCGEWLEEGETVTYDPCPPDLEGGN